jgi:catechol 2,3-dioxygenase-like lactoylglutathione lyase family enzyme
MLVSRIFHVAIKTADLEATIAFYTRVMGLVVYRRPDFDFQGAWLAPAVAGAEAILHVYAGDAARGADGRFESGTAAIDHVSLNAQGFAEQRDRFLRLGLPYRENVVPGLPFWQLFVYDPNGVMLELTYHAEAEGGVPPSIPAELQYRPREVFFSPVAYRQFSSTPVTELT